MRDGRFLYTVMEVYWEPEYPRLTEAECFFPPALLENPSREISAYYKWVTEGLRIAATHQHDPQKAQILAQLEVLATTAELDFLKEETT